MRPTNFVLSCILVLPFSGGCQGQAADQTATEPVIDPPAIDAPALSLAALIHTLKLDPRTIRFHVDKSVRQFTVFVNDTLLKTYPCVLGEQPIGDKYHQGDRKTPEGTFTFRSKRVHYAWHKFIWVDYPNEESYRRFQERKAQGLIPKGKDIGGEIGIHGVPDGMDHWIDAGQDWTFGCIALKNADVDEIYPYILAMRTTMVIEP